MHGLVKGHGLALLAGHCADCEVAAEREALNSLKALAQVRLHRQRVFRLREDLQELVVGEKEEAREREALRLQVVCEALLHRVEKPPAVKQRLEVLLAAGGGEDGGRALSGVERLAPCAVHRREALALERQLLHDVSGAEDGLEVHPRALHR